MMRTIVSPKTARKIGATQAVARVVAGLTAFTSFAFLAGSAFADPADSYAVMAPIEAYLMDRAEEVDLARSTAPDSISGAATILVLTRTGYETAITGTNGFVCMVGRGFGGPFDWAERLSPKIRAAECQNPQAARSIMPFALLRTPLLLERRSIAKTTHRIEVALDTGKSRRSSPAP